MSQAPTNQSRIPVNIANVSRNTDRAAVIGESKEKFDDQRLMQHFDVALSSSDTIDSLLVHISKIVLEQSQCLALWVAQRTPEGKFSTPHRLTDEGDLVWEVVQETAAKMIGRVDENRRICSTQLRLESATSLVVAPVISSIGADAQVDFALIGCFSNDKESILRQQWLMGIAGQSVARWAQNQTIYRQQTNIRSLNDAMGLIHALDETQSISQASLVVANHLRKLCQTEQVAVCYCDDTKVGTLKAVSDVETLDANSESNKLISNACNQAIVAGKPLSYPPTDDGHTPELLTLEKYCKANGAEACLVVPLVTANEKIIGSVLFAVNEAQLANEQFHAYIGRMLSMVSGHLDVVVRANHGLRDVLKRRWIEFKKSKLTKTCLIGALILIGLMFVPLPYRVGCDCEIQPVMRRFIASPYDGILDKSHTENGQIVEKDEVIAHLDGRQLRIEVSGLRAELAGAKKRRDSALAQGDIAKSQIARSEMRRYASKIEIIENQLKNLEIRSPIAGIVVNGDLEKVEGSPLEMGQTLFEIAPLEEMVAEIGIPESEIQYVEPGMNVAIKLNAFPFRTWNGTIKSIYPRTEIINDESVFIAQVNLENFEHQLRPGMKGSAKITSQWSPVGWNLFHQPWESVRYWMIW